MLRTSMSLAVAAAIAFTAAAGASPAQAAGNNSSPDFWWPERLDLRPLRQHAAESNPYGADFDLGFFLGHGIRS